MYAKVTPKKDFNELHVTHAMITAAISLTAINHYSNYIGHSTFIVTWSSSIMLAGIHSSPLCLNWSLKSSSATCFSLR